jgi:hypothetical protein
VPPIVKHHCSGERATSDCFAPMDWTLRMLEMGRLVRVIWTKVERAFAAKPASVKIKTRALKKLKDAAL